MDGVDEIDRLYLCIPTVVRHFTEHFTEHFIERRWVDAVSHIHYSQVKYGGAKTRRF